MLTDHRTRKSDLDLERRIELQIRQRTSGRIHRLRVEASRERAVIHGHTYSYYAKQLAIQAVREILDSAAVEIDIEVGDLPSTS